MAASGARTPLTAVDSGGPPPSTNVRLSAFICG